MRTIYVCPTLMHIAYPFIKWKLRKTCRVFWKVSKYEEDRISVKYLVAQPLTIPEGGRGGWQVSVPFPRWVSKLEMDLRSFGLKLYCHFRHPIRTFESYQYKFRIRKRQKIYEAKRK